jgi:hypothetical protein
MAEETAQPVLPADTPKAHAGEPFSSNAIRLSLVEWAAAAVVIAVVVLALPGLVQPRAHFHPSPDYRHPYQYSEDYWLYAQYSGYAAQRYPVAVIGDSVVWGHYVAPAGTLSHFLTREAGQPLFANLGLDGTRPMALDGLVRYYCKGLSGQGVILHLNPLWMSSPDADLYQRSKPPGVWARVANHVRTSLSREPPATDEAARINHARLVPQLADRPNGYRPSLDEIVGIGFERQMPYVGWLRHLQTVDFENLGLQSWTLSNPYRNPLRAITREFPQPDDRPEGDPVPWSQSGIERQDFPWVPLAKSYQWARFRDTVELLRARHNGVFVLVGPMNTHLMSPASARGYVTIRQGMEAWLAAQGVPYYSPPTLPSALYADASHPLRGGYAQLARGLFANGPFRQWLAQVAPRGGLTPGKDLADARRSSP